MTYASLGGLEENAQIHLTLNKTENTSLNQSQLADLGINTHLSTTSIITQNTQQWNIRENLREKQQGGGVLQRGNAYNTRAYLGELSGKGERDDLLPALILAPTAIETTIMGAGVVSACITHKLLKEKAQREGISLDENAKGLGVVYCQPKVGDVIDLDHFSRRQKVTKDDPLLVDPKTGWSLQKDRDGHKGGKWKLRDNKGKRKATLDENRKVVGK